VTDPLLPVGDGHTALSEEDREELIPSYIATRDQLLGAEQTNIAEALLRRAPALNQILDDKYLRDLHQAMFGNVWKWAGKYRRRETNIGIEPNEIPVAVRTLVDDANGWIEHRVYEADELFVRFHHGLVAIHPFVNGNGRHGRIAADYLALALSRERFTWGAGLKVGTDELRARYIRALQRADGGEMAYLVAFARS